MADDSTARTLAAAIFDELERSVPGARRDARGGLVLDGQAVSEAARRGDAQTGEVGYAARPRDPDAASVRQRSLFEGGEDEDEASA